jgi:hypothetical protein
VARALHVMHHGSYTMETHRETHTGYCDVKDCNIGYLPKENLLQHLFDAHGWCDACTP